ncbi:MAG TPA: hypothetical protein VFE51_30300 [Verrucomicrobiae bacterium]|nr:hypothetical protein [Verrucomicrobiae bacterium]
MIEIFRRSTIVQFQKRRNAPHSKKLAREFAPDPNASWHINRASLYNSPADAYKYRITNW